MKKSIILVAVLCTVFFACNEKTGDKEKDKTSDSPKVKIDPEEAEKDFVELGLPMAILNAFVKVMETTELDQAYISDSVYLYINPELLVLTGDNYYYESVKYADLGDSTQIKLVSQLLLEQGGEKTFSIDSIKFDGRFKLLKDLSKKQLSEKNEEYSPLAYVRISSPTFSKEFTSSVFFITLNYAGKTLGYLVFGEFSTDKWKIVDYRMVAEG